MLKLLLTILLFSNQGFTMDKLTECPDKPNCISSQSEKEYAQISPLKIKGDLKSTKEKLIQIMSDLPRTKLIKNEANYLHFTVKTRLIRFTDDVEFLIDEENGVVHIKSASRTGYKDFGVNRERLENIRSMW